MMIKIEQTSGIDTFALVIVSTILHHLKGTRNFRGEMSSCSGKCLAKIEEFRLIGASKRFFGPTGCEVGQIYTHRYQIGQYYGDTTPKLNCIGCSILVWNLFLLKRF